MSIIVAFIIGIICGGGVLFLLEWAYERGQQRGRESCASPESAGTSDPSPPAPTSLWPEPQGEARPEVVRIAASTVGVAMRLQETARLLNRLTEDAYERGLGVAMKLERDYDEELFGEEERPSPYELKVLVYQPLQFMEPREARCCGGAHPHR